MRVNSEVQLQPFNITGFNGTYEAIDGIGNTGILLDVLHVPNILKSIISTTTLSSNGCNIYQSKTKSWY